MTRTITTATELDALPFPSAVAFPGYGDWYKIRDGRWMCDDGDILTSGELALVANGELAMTGDPSAPVLVVSDAAVEAGARALFEEMQELDQENSWDDPLPDEWREAWRDAARETLTAALPHLAAVPSAEHIARTLAETTALTGADARLVVQAAVALSGPSATRADVAGALEFEFGGCLAHDPQDRDRFWGGAADALLARFTITPRTDR